MPTTTSRAETIAAGRPRAGRRPPPRSRRRRAAPDPRRGGGPGRPAGGLAPGAAGRRPLPRGRAARQRRRVRLLARGGRTGRRRGRRGQPDPSRRRTGPRPDAHRVPAPGDRVGRTSRWSRAQRSAPALGTVTHDNDRVLVLDTEQAQAALAPFAGTAAADVVERQRDARHAGLPALHVRHLGRAEGLPVQPGTPGPHRQHRGPDVLRWCPTTSATCPCRSSTPTR